MTSIATMVVLDVVLLSVVYVVVRLLVHGVSKGTGYEIEVKLLPPSIRVRQSGDGRR
jgi:hypothetical protein